MYKQCFLKSNNKYQVAWIPTELAIKNKTVVFISDKTLWTVSQVYQTELTEDQINKEFPNYGIPNAEFGPSDPVQPYSSIIKFSESKYRHSLPNLKESNAQSKRNSKTRRSKTGIKRKSTKA